MLTSRGPSFIDSAKPWGSNKPLSICSQGFITVLTTQWKTPREEGGEGLSPRCPLPHVTLKWSQQLNEQTCSAVLVWQRPTMKPLKFSSILKLNAKLIYGATTQSLKNVGNFEGLFLERDGGGWGVLDIFRVMFNCNKLSNLQQDVMDEDKACLTSSPAVGSSGNPQDKINH